ncbi:MAG: hypothetical protein M3O80_03460 [Chloroflexota bacterium]|nr:hypothetical protein [Chloroflexota bacterium]
MAPEAILLRGLLWFGIASLGMVPYFVALRRLRTLIAANGSSKVSTADLLDHPQVDPVLEDARRRCRRRLFIGVGIYFLCAPLLPWIYNA